MSDETQQPPDEQPTIQEVVRQYWATSEARFGEVIQEQMVVHEGETPAQAVMRVFLTAMVSVGWMMNACRDQGAIPNVDKVVGLGMNHLRAAMNGTAAPAMAPEPVHPGLPH